MSKVVENKKVVYVLENGEARMEFESLGDAREAVRSLDANSVGATVRITKETHIVEIMNTYTAQTKQVVSFIEEKTE